jgi:mannose-6-phosphate isomerase-like protein (cupin superfamily)
MAPPAWREEVVPLEPGVCLTIPVGTAFQFRTSGPDALEAVAVTMPPWPGDDEAQPAQGRWVTEGHSRQSA